MNAEKLYDVTITYTGGKPLSFYASEFDKTEHGILFTVRTDIPPLNGTDCSGDNILIVPYTNVRNILIVDRTEEKEEK